MEDSGKQIASVQATKNNLQAQVEGLQATYSYLQNQLNSIQSIINDIKQSSQVVVKTGFVSNGEFIPVPDTYDIIHCKVIIGLSTTEHNVVGNLVVYSFPSTTSPIPPYFTNIITEVTPDTTKNGFNVKITNSNSEGLAPAMGNLAYMLIGVKRYFIL